MEWKEFLQHPEIVSYTKDHPNSSPGEYLYKKILHDILECLNGHKGFIKVASLIQSIPDDIQSWFLKWQSSNEAWISSLTTLSEYCYRRKIPQDDTEWPSLITNLARIPFEVSLQCDEAQQLIIPPDEPLKSLTMNAISSIKRLNLICKYIQNQDYIRLWTTDY